MSRKIRIMIRRDSLSIDHSLRSEQTRYTTFLILTQPRFARFAQDPTAEEIDQLTDDDKHEGDRIHEVDGIMEDLDADDDAPEVHGQHGNVEESSGRQPEEERSHAVEEGQAKGVSGEITTDFAVPGGGPERSTVENAGLGTVDDHAPERHLAQHFVDGCCADKVLFSGVGETVESCAQEGEQVPFQLVAAANIAAVGAGDMVGCDQDAHAADTDQNTQNLRDVIADA